MNKYNSGRNPIQWTPQMLKMLMDYFPIMMNEPLAKMLKISLRTLERKARELGLRKPDDYREKRAYDFNKRNSEGLKMAYAEGRKVSNFKKGVRNNEKGEFRKGFKFEGEIEAKRVEAIRANFKRMRLLRAYGVKEK